MKTWQEIEQKWATFTDLEAELKKELAALTTEQKEDAFYRNLEFGTAGMRGILGVGTNRMNIYTIRKANDGFARFIVSNGEVAKQKGIVIAYDSRHMSREFAYESAKVMASHGIKAYVFEELRPTPELSFAVRYLKAFAGIVITASHNPKDYNGYKIYDETGCQCIPEVAAEVVKLVEGVQDELSLKVDSLETYVEKGLIEFIGSDVDEAYNDAVIATTFANVSKEDISLVYTALHGTGYTPIKKAFDSLGYTNIHYVEKQCQPDAEFTTVPLPNPEDPKVFGLAEELGRTTNADVLLATDPDADRLGIAVKKADGTYELLNGNVTGALMTYYILDRLKANNRLPKNGIIFTTVVSSDFAEKIATHFNVETERTLTGFKFIGDRIHAYEQTGEKVFLFGFEESYGSLVNATIARDKDAVQAVVILAEMTAFYKEQGKTLLDVIKELEEKFGVFKEGLENISLAGIQGAEKIKHLISTISEKPFTEMAGEKIAVFENYITRERHTDNGTESISLPQADVLKFILESGTWFCVRPSGTEPKAKVYISVCEETEIAANEKVEALRTEIMKEINKILA